MLFTDQYMEDKKRMQDVGEFLISITITNVVVNCLPLFITQVRQVYRRFICKHYIKHKRASERKKAEARKKEALLRKLRARNEAEEIYGRRIEMRFKAAADSQ